MKALQNVRINLTSALRQSSGSYWEEKTVESQQEFEHDAYVFIYSVLYNANMFAFILSSGVGEEVEDYNPFEATEPGHFDTDDQNERVIVELIENIRQPFSDFYWDGGEDEEEMDDSPLSE